jgi:hypothetical protein
MTVPPASPDDVTRSRAPGEFFGLEQALWEDRHDGRVAAGYLRLLDEAAVGLAARAASALPAEEAARVAALRVAVERGRAVLQAAREAIDALQRRPPGVAG